MPDEMFVPRDDDEPVVAQRLRARRIPALMSTISVNTGNKLMNGNLNAPISIKRYAVPKTRPSELTRANFAGQHPRLEVCKGRLKPTVGGRSQKGWEAYASGRINVYPSLSTNVFVLRSYSY